MNECRDRKSLGVGAKVLGISLPGAKVPGSESSKNFRSWERKFQGTKVPYHGTFAPGSESS